MGKRSRGRKSAKGWEEEHESRAELLMCPSATCTLFGAPVLPPEDSGEAAADTVIGSSDTVTGTTLQSVVTLFMEDEVSPTLLAFKPVRTRAAPPRHPQPFAAAEPSHFPACDRHA